MPNVDRRSYDVAASQESQGNLHSVIARLEDADYQGHSLSMLQRIASALNKRLEIRFVAANREIAA